MHTQGSSRNCTQGGNKTHLKLMTTITWRKIKLIARHKRWMTHKMEQEVIKQGAIEHADKSLTK